MDVLTSNTDRLTDGFTHIPKRTRVWHVFVCNNTDGFSGGSKTLAGFLNFFGAHFNQLPTKINATDNN
jgi:hypothetical protein